MQTQLPDPTGCSSHSTSLELAGDVLKCCTLAYAALRAHKLLCQASTKWNAPAGKLLVPLGGRSGFAGVMPRAMRRTSAPISR